MTRRQTLLEAMVPPLAYLLIMAALGGVYGIAAGIDAIRGAAVRDYAAQHASAVTQSENPFGPPGPNRPLTPDEKRRLEELVAAYDTQLVTPEEKQPLNDLVTAYNTKPMTPQDRKALSDLISAYCMNLVMMDDARRMVLMELDDKQRLRNNI